MQVSMKASFSLGLEYQEVHVLYCTSMPIPTSMFSTATSLAKRKAKDIFVE